MLRHTLHRTKTLVIFLIALFLMTASTVFAATLSEYNKNLKSAKGHVEQLLQSVPTESNRTPHDFRREQIEISGIRREIPESEKIEWSGDSVQTENQWLFEELDKFQNESDGSKQAPILISINERLDAMIEKVDELDKATSAERSKDEDKQKLAEILRREEFQKPAVKDESLFQKGWSAFLKWLEDLFPKSPITPPTEPEFGSLKLFIQILIYAAVIGVIGFLIFRFWPLIAGRFGYKPKKKKRDRVILGERIGEDESANDLFSEAERLAREGQLRDAIRKGYIAVLCELSDRKIIGLARHKTNRDYLRDVRKRAGLFENMSGLTGTYERNWYGLRPSRQDDWEDFRDRYKRTIADANL